MTLFNGPALAAEALRRLDHADQSGPGTLDAQHQRETAAVYATLALTAATLGEAYADRDKSDDEQWADALNPGSRVDGAA